jgi:hypothetical protein
MNARGARIVAIYTDWKKSKRGEPAVQEAGRMEPDGHISRRIERVARLWMGYVGQNTYFCGRI